MGFHARRVFAFLLFLILLSVAVFFTRIKNSPFAAALAATPSSLMRDFLFPSTDLSDTDLYWRAANYLPCKSYLYGSRQYPFQGGPMEPPLHNLSLCDLKWNSKTARRKARKFLEDRQFPQNCSLVQIGIVGPFAVSGIGSTLHLMMGAFNAALCDNRTVVYREAGSWVWADCPRQNPNCYFEPISSCIAPVSREAGTRIRYYSAASRHPNEKCVPKEFASQSYNWWRTQLMSFLLRPSERVKEAALMVALETFQTVPKRPLLAVFIRRSDKLREMEQFYTVAQYFESWAALSTLPVRYRPQSIYLNSEDPAVIPEAQAFFYAEELYIPPLTRGFPSFGGSNVSQRMLSSLADLYIEAAADYQAGTLTSNWCRLVDELRLGRGKNRTPYFSPEHTVHRYQDS